MVALIEAMWFSPRLSLRRTARVDSCDTRCAVSNASHTKSQNGSASTQCRHCAIYLVPASQLSFAFSVVGGRPRAELLRVLRFDTRGVALREPDLPALDRLGAAVATAVRRTDEV